jgi:hypothetical protein
MTETQSESVSLPSWCVLFGRQVPADAQCRRWVGTDLPSEFLLKTLER